MPAPCAISSEKLFRLIGGPDCPALIDVRTDDDFSADARLVPGSHRRPYETVAAWAESHRGRSAVIVCEKGRKLSQGVAAFLRHAGVPAESLDGGFVAWKAAGRPLVAEARIPPRDVAGRTLWVTRARPKVDRIACPWLIRRFVDPGAVFLFVNASDVMGVAQRFSATPFDIDDPGAFWSHRGDLCTFDVMVDEFGLSGFDGLRLLQKIVRGADTARLDLVPEAAGLLAVSLGLSRMHADDLEQLEAGMGIYDAFYRWCRDAVDETHNWPKHRARPEGGA